MPMTREGFRKMALSLPDAVEGAHFGHPDFRVGGKVFATLGYPDLEWAMVKLTPEQQRAFVESAPAVFAPVKGGWGVRGATNVRLSSANARVVRPALTTAWRNNAPRRLAATLETGSKRAAATTRRPAARPRRRKA